MRRGKFPNINVGDYMCRLDYHGEGGRYCGGILSVDWIRGCLVLRDTISTVGGYHWYSEECSVLSRKTFGTVKGCRPNEYLLATLGYYQYCGDTISTVKDGQCCKGIPSVRWRDVRIICVWQCGIPLVL